MKIFIAASWLKLGGGVTRTLFELLKRIDYDKHSVTLMLMELDKSVLSYLPEEVKVIASGDSFQTDGAGAILKKLLKKGKFFTAASYALNLVDFRLTGNNYRHQAWITKHMAKQDEEYDVAIAYAMMNSIVNKYVIDNVKAKKKIMWCHTDVNIYEKKYIKGLEKLYPQYDRINCVCGSALESLSRKFPLITDKLHIAYNFIDTKKIIEEAAKFPDIDISDNQIKLCTVGRISREKGIDILTDVAKKLSDVGTDFVWWVIGPRFDKAYSSFIEQKISDYGLEEKVLLLGEKNPPYPFMNACDIYVQPSRYEGFCTTTNEARILKKPVVTTCVSGADEQFTNGVDGTITEISAEAIYTAVAELISSTEKRKAYTENLRSRLNVAQENSFESMIL